MTQQDKNEMFAHKLQQGIKNAHRHGLSWFAIETALKAELERVREKRAKIKDYQIARSLLEDGE